MALVYCNFRKRIISELCIGAQMKAHQSRGIQWHHMQIDDTNDRRAYEYDVRMDISQ